MVLVDSSVWIDYFNGAPTFECDTLDALLGRELVLQGFRTDAGYRQARALLDPLTLCQLGGREVALAAAENYRRMRARGVTVRKTIDVIIASFCMLHGLDLVHADRDFDAMEPYLGLQVYQPA